jgi:hypothetical protein
MLSRRFRPSPALAVSMLALAVALAGTGYAATSLPAGSVGTAQLRNGAVVATKVKAHSLVASNFAVGQLPKGPPGPVGLAGPAGPAGAKGDPAQKAWALVGKDGSVIRSSGGVQGSKAGGGDGRFDVSFQQDIGNCTPTVNVAGTGRRPDEGFASASITDSHTVRVQTFDTGGGENDETFSVAVFC